MPREKYRLEALLKIKERAKRKAEIVLAKALASLEAEKKKLKVLEEKKKEVEDQKEKARRRMSEKVARGQALVKESQFHLGYIQKLTEDIEAIRGEIKEQEGEIAKAETKLKRARRDYMDSAYELNVMEKHKELWVKKQRQALSALENKQMNELGNTLYQMNKMRG